MAHGVFCIVSISGALFVICVEKLQVKLHYQFSDKIYGLLT